MARVTPSTTPLLLRNSQRGRLALFMNGERIPGVVGVDVEQGCDGCEAAVVVVRISARAVRFETEQVEEAEQPTGRDDAALAMRSARA